MKAKVLFASVFCAVLLLSGCGGRSASFRYKLTLSLDTPDGVKTGFNVVELDYFDVSIPMRGTGHTTRGEGIYIDLGPGRRPLIALLTHIGRKDEGCSPCNFWWREDEPSWAIAKACLSAQDYKNMSFDLKPEGVVGGIKRIAQECRKPIPLTPSVRNLPELITFSDVNDPKSVMSVDPANLAATLGSDVIWRSITIQTTDEPLTKDIDQHLPWVRGYNDNIPISGINSAMYGNGTFISRRDFIREN